MLEVESVARRVRLPAIAVLRPVGAILKRREMAQLRGCDDLMRSAQRGIEQATTEAALEAQRQVWQQALPLMRQLEQLRADLDRQAQDFLIMCARRGLERLLVDVPEDWPARSSVQLLVREAMEMRSSEAFELRMHPVDLELLKRGAASLPGLSLVADASLTRGRCLLTCAQGEMRADFIANVASLASSLCVLGEQSSARQLLTNGGSAS